MPASRVALVAENQAAVRPVADCLREALGEAPLLHSYATIGDILDAEADGMVVLTILKSGDEDAASNLVQDISLQKFPPLVVLVDLAARGPNHQEIERR